MLSRTVIDVQSAQTHHLVFTETEVRKRYVSWERGEPDREWTCLNLLATNTPGLAPTPLRRETDPDGAPVVVMERIRGAPLGEEPFTPAQVASLGRALRRVSAVPSGTVLKAGVTERLSGPSTLGHEVMGRLRESWDFSQCQDATLVQAAVEATLGWLSDAGSLPESETLTLGVSDRKPANILWDGQSCRLVDFEDSGLSDPAYEAADTIEHLAGRVVGGLDPDALFDAAGLSPEQRQRGQAYRRLWAAFWLVVVMPGNGGFLRNPPGTTEMQAAHLLGLLR